MIEPQVIISVEEIRPGMVLAAPAIDRRGRMLAPIGVVLTQQLQRQLRLCGAEAVTVAAASMPPPMPAEAEPPQVRVSEWWQLDERDPFMHALARLARERYARYQHAKDVIEEGSRT